MCRDLFNKKLHDYGAAWRILRIPSVTDQIFIKAKRIRSINEKGESQIAEGSSAEFIGIVNYGIIGLIQLALKPSIKADISNEEALALYDKYANETYELMIKKNHDYDEAWRSMRVSSYRLNPHENLSHETNRGTARQDNGLGRYRCELSGHGKLLYICFDKT